MTTTDRELWPISAVGACATGRSSSAGPRGSLRERVGRGRRIRHVVGGQGARQARGLAEIAAVIGGLFAVSFFSFDLVHSELGHDHP